jgi:hypothetical protein
MGAIKFVFVFFLAASVVAVASVAWGRVTTSPKPQVLEAVSAFVIQTPAGAALAQVLGATAEANPEPINVSSVAASLVGSVAGAIAQRAQDAVASQAIIQVAKGYDQLPEDQKKLLEGLICQPQAQ